MRRRESRERNMRERRGKRSTRRALRNGEEGEVVFAGPARLGLGKYACIRANPRGRDVGERRVVAVYRGTADANVAGDAAVGEQEILRDVRIGDDDALRVDEHAATACRTQAAPCRGIADDIHERATQGQCGSVERGALGGGELYRNGGWLRGRLRLRGRCRQSKRRCFLIGNGRRARLRRARHGVASF